MADCISKKGRLEMWADFKDYPYSDVAMLLSHTFVADDAIYEKNKKIRALIEASNVMVGELEGHGYADDEGVIEDYLNARGMPE